MANRCLDRPAGREAVIDYDDHDAAGLALLVAESEASADALLDDALERASLVNPQLNAVVVLRRRRRGA